MKFHAVLTHFEARFNPFNPTAYANIPEYWECQLVEMPEKLDDDYGHLNIYGTDQNSAQGSVDDLINQMKANGWTGTLKVRK